MALRRTSASSPEASTISQRQKNFPNGDKYKGGWKNGLPEGTGVYEWADGSIYEGGWKGGAKHGIGFYKWPSGATYRGEWLAGCMHGSGTFEAPDGTRYQGGWFQDLKQGLGKKVYANGDCYEGLWKAGKAEGPGRYRWVNNNEYDGEWKNGKMHGQGTLKWSSGERYDGEWVDGAEEGVGIFTWTDGSTYDGFWRAGKKHGVGVYRPAQLDSKRSMPMERINPALSTAAAAAAAVAQSDETDRNLQDAGPVPAPMMTGAASITSRAPASDEGVSEMAMASTSGRLGEKSDAVVYVREYDGGKLMREDRLHPDEIEAVFGPVNKRAERRERRQRRRNRKVEQRPGETIFKGHRSYDLMLDLQLGVRYSVGKLAVEQVPQLREEHFKQKIKQSFPRDGSKATPPHPSADFKWKDYCPLAFRKLRQVFAIEPADYMLSICGDQALRELASPGKSGSVFFLTNDDKYIIKTMRKGEVKLLLELLPRYTAHVEGHPHTLLIKFYGLHRVKPTSGQKVRFIVMNNLFRTDLAIHRKYDLKGSTHGRVSGKADASTILKDLDLETAFKLEEGWHDKLMNQMVADCELLEDLKVMDYSLLLGVHFRGAGYLSSPPATDREDEGDDDGNDTPTGNSMRLRSAGPSGIPPLSPSALGVPPPPSQFESERVPTATVQWDGLTTTDHQAMQERIMAKLGGRMSEKKLSDLLKLAQYKMLSRDYKSHRSPTMVLAMRPKRSETMRPMAFSQGATDEITHSMGATRTRLGMNMAATAVPLPVEGQPPGQPEDVVLYFGIIDILQEYNLTKQTEHFFKSIRHDGNAISAVDPRHYSRRFQDFLRKVFI